MTFADWFATSPIASWLRTFVAIILAMFIADGADIFAVDAADLRAWVAAGFAAILPVIVRWLNPQDAEFGRGSIVFEPFDVWDEDDSEPEASR
jgi:hypothetical protein